MDKKQELMEFCSFCRLYKGEKENPYKGEQNKACLWSYERAWLLEFAKPQSRLLMSYLSQYTAVGLTCLIDMQELIIRPMKLLNLLKDSIINIM